MDDEFTELKVVLDSLRKQLDDIDATQTSLNEIIGESYANRLSNMTKAEAVQHLRSVDDSTLFHTYLKLSNLFLFRNWNHPVLAEICLRYMASMKSLDRMMGAGDIGIWLEGTHDKKASQALALMIRNTEETDEIRRSAYSSLQLINNKATPLECLRRETRPTSESGNMLQEVDWIFVDSFL